VGGEMKPGVINLYPPSQLKLWGCYVISVGLGIDCGLCFVEADAVFCLCRAFGYR
jgi:hypothetical protein